MQTDNFYEKDSRIMQQYKHAALTLALLLFLKTTGTMLRYQLQGEISVCKGASGRSWNSQPLT